MQSLGQIKFMRESDGGLFIRQNWNPQAMPRDDRLTAAITLRQIADAMDEDKFEDGGEYVHFESPEQEEIAND